MKKEITASCLNCKCDTKQTIESEIRKDIPSIISVESFGKNMYDISGFYQIILCQSCDSYSYRTYGEVYNCPVAGEDEVTTEKTLTSEILYPERITIGHRDVKKYALMPLDIYNTYTTAISSFNRKMYAPCAVMLRRVIELTCDETIRKNNLAGEPYPRLELKINMLLNANKIKSEDVALLHAIRKQGNHTIHTNWEPQVHSLSENLDGVEEIFSSLFDFHLEF